MRELRKAGAEEEEFGGCLKKGIKRDEKWVKKRGHGLNGTAELECQKHKGL